MRLAYALLLVVVSVSSVAAPVASGPEAKLEVFLETLKSGKYEGALQAFFENGLTAQQKATELRALDAQVKAAFEFYGAPSSWETVETKKVGSDLVNIRLISKHKDEVPLFWNALFYRRHEQWEPLGIYFFDDPKRAGFW